MLAYGWKLLRIQFSLPSNAERGERSEPSEARKRWKYHAQADASNEIQSSVRKATQAHTHKQTNVGMSALLVFFLVCYFVFVVVYTI